MFMNDIDNILYNCLYQIDTNGEYSIDRAYEECACKYGFKTLNLKNKIY